MSVDVNYSLCELHTPIQTVCLYRYYLMHRYSTFQGLRDNFVLLRKKSCVAHNRNAVRREGKARGM